jgi:hypothetical protein
MADHHMKSRSRRVGVASAGAMVLALLATPACTPLTMLNNAASHKPVVKTVKPTKKPVKKPAAKPTRPVVKSPAAGTGASGTPLPPSTTGVQARTADSIVDAYGVNIHMNATKGRYGNVAAVTNALKNLHVRHVRDVLYTNAPREYAALNTLGANGIKVNVVMGRPDNAGGTPQQLVDLVAGTVRPAVESVEGANEWDLQRDPGNWAVNLRNHQTQIYNLIKSTPATRTLPVLAPALGRYSGWNVLGDMTQISDYGNLHIYPGGRTPTFQLDKTDDLAKASYGNDRIYTTEAGFTDAMNNTSTHRPTPEDVEGVYAPRLLLEHYIRGDVRMYQYELINERDVPNGTDKEANFGLLNYDWSAKPQYTAMQNMLGLLDDGDAAFTPGKLDYSLSGNTAGVSQTLVQKADGSFYLMLWRDVSMYDALGMKRQAVAAQNVTVNLPASTSVSVYRPSVQSAPVSSSSDTQSVSLTIGADVQMVRIG